MFISASDGSQACFLPELKHSDVYPFSFDAYPQIDVISNNLVFPVELLL